MDVATFYVGQGALAVVRHQGEAIIVDAHLPSSDSQLRGRVASQLYRTLHAHSRPHYPGGACETVASR